MIKSLIYNTKLLMAFILRRDKIRLPVWILSISLFIIILGASYPSLFPTPEERQALALVMENPAVIFMLGTSEGLDNYTIGAIFGHTMLIFSSIAVAIMNIMLFTRHTRGDEEEGRIEVIRSLPVGRLANINATIIVLLIANLLMGLIIGFGLAILNIASMDFNGSLLFGLSLTVFGIFYLGVTAIFAQLSESARGTIGLSFMFLIFTYLLRGIGDVSSEVLSWLSPYTWIVKTDVYVNNIWWPIIFTLFISTLLIAFAYYLNSLRDLEAGFIPHKAGRSTAKGYLKSPLGLGYRILFTTILFWLMGVFVIGLSYGSIFGDLDAFLDNSVLAEILPEVEGYSKEVLFISFLNIVMAILCTIPSLTVLLKIKGEEKKGRIQHILSKSISRNKVLGSYLFLSIIVSIVSLFISCFGLWSAIYTVMEDPIPFDIMFSSSTIYLFALLFMIGLTLFLIGYYPQASGFIWLYLGYSFFSLYLGELLKIPEWMKKLTPFGYIPKLPIDNVNYLTLSLMTIISLTFIIIGFIGYNKRDILG